MAEGAVAAGGGEVALGGEGGVGCVGYEAGGGDVIIYGRLGSGGECDVLFFWCEDERFGDVPAVAAAFDCYLLSLVACHFVCESQLEMYGIARDARSYN